MKYRFALPRKVLLAIRHFQSSDETRYILNALQIEVTRTGEATADVLIVGTNGRVLGAYIRKAADFSPGDAAVTLAVGCTHTFILNIDILAETPSEGVLELEVEQVPGRAALVSVFGVKHCAKLLLAAIDAKYPDFRPCFPTLPPVPIVWMFDPKYLGCFVKAAEELNCSSTDEMAIFGHRTPDVPDDIHPNAIACLSVRLKDPNFYGVFMPVRINPELILSKLPECLTARRPLSL